MAFFLGLLLAPVAFSADFQWREKDSRKGYVSSVDESKEDVGIPIIYVENPDANNRALREQIFDEKLTKEFTLRYQDKFGRTEAETYYTRSNVFEYMIVQGKEYSQEQYFKEQRSFSTYVLRRTAEYHFDNRGKEITATRPLIETKEKLQNVNIGFGKNFKVKAKYSIAANDFGVGVENPYVDYRMTIPTNLHSTTVNIGKAITSIYYIESYYNAHTGSVSLIGRRKLTDLASVSITLTPNSWREEEGLRESYGLAGLSWLF